ncbi:MAG: hypothetical protein MUO73_03400 [Thermoplasmata archaeon]|nr:hypothetical protein [Thermoplasmata archaeon]
MRKQNEFMFKFPGGNNYFTFNDLRRFNLNRAVIVMRNTRDDRVYHERLLIRDALRKFG